MNRRLILALAASALSIAAVLAWLGGGHSASDRAAAPPEPAPVSRPGTTPAAVPTIRYPIPASAPGDGGAEAATALLPPLSSSDEEIYSALAGLVGEEAVRQYLLPEDIVRRVVATVDNLPRRKLAVRLRPVMPAPGSFVAGGVEDAPRLDPQNFARYAPAVRVLESLDAGALAAVYFRFYPLFQTAYEELGYPDRHFNDRLVESIDDLLAAPAIETPIALVRAQVLYEFADPALEARSAGQKLLMRMGPQNARAVKVELRELRDELTRGAR